MAHPRGCVLLVLVLVMQLLGNSVLSVEPPSSSSLPMPAPESASTAKPMDLPATLTINRCDQRNNGSQPYESSRLESFVTTIASDDCDCPPGYQNIGQSQQSKPPLCVRLLAPGPWQEACVPSGTSTDYYDLRPDELDMVSDFLHRMGVSECWISARRIAARGALVRRLPGQRWNERIVPDGHRTSVTLESEPRDETIGPGCAAIGNAQLRQLTIRNCLLPLHQLCLYRERPLLRLHCRQKEYTTRYAALQRYCFSMRLITTDTITWLGSTQEYQQIRSTEARDRKLLNVLWQRFQADEKKSCRFEEAPLAPPALHQRALVKRAQAMLSPRKAPGPAKGLDDSCILLRRIAFGRSLGKQEEEEEEEEEEVDRAAPSMHLYFDKSRYKLFLTVYSGWRFWREKPSETGFGCYTNADVELIRRVKTVKLRKLLPLSRTQTYRGDQGDDDDSSGGTGGAADRTMYEVELVKSGVPGRYWCEAHVMPDFTHLTSASVLAHRKPDGKSFFSATVELAMNSTNVASMRLATYDRHIKEYIKSNHASRPDLKPIFTAIKSVQVKRLDDAWPSPEPGGHIVRLVLHVVMKRVKSWRDFPAIADEAANEIELPEKDVYYYKMRWYLHSALNSLNGTGFRFAGVNSTEYCLPDGLTVAPGGNVWWSARLGETVAPKNLCLVEQTGLPMTRRCMGDFVYGCAWEAGKPTGDEQCARLEHPSVTRVLYEYSTSQLNRSVLAHVFGTVGSVLAIPASVLPADLFYISKTLENVRAVLVPEAVPSRPEVPEGEGKSLREPSEAADRTEEQYYCNITGIMNRLMYVNKTTVVRSQVALNTTNILLDAIETMLNGMALANESEALLRGARFDCDRRTGGQDGELTLASNDGTVLFRSPRLIVLIADPTVANISGLALLRKDPPSSDSFMGEAMQEEEGDFGNFTIRYLHTNQSQAALFTEPGLEIGSFIPQSVLDSLGPLQEAMTQTTEETDPLESTAASTEQSSSPSDVLISPPDTSGAPEEDPEPSAAVPVVLPPHLRIVVMVYYNDRAFRETNNGTIARPNSKIISVTIPGYGSRMPDEIPIYTRQHNPSRASRCGYWSFDADDHPGEFGRWSYDECRLVNSSASGALALCACFHLTSFSRLTMDTQMVETVGVSKKLIADQSSLALDVITVIGCSLSLLGVIGILVTAVVFPSWRTKASSKILLQLSCAIAVEMIIIFFEGPDIDKHGLSTLDEIECTLLGSVFHYIILVTFMWMLVSAYLQFMRYVKVLGRLRPSHFILKTTMCCWGLPALPVIIFLALDYQLYLKRDNFSDICYPHGSALYYGLLLPIGVIIFLNFVSFVFVLFHICTIPGNLTKTADHDMTLAQLRLSVFLFFLLGLPWIFGMLTTGNVDKLFAYLFCLTAPLQGFVLFVYFIIMDPIARRLWLRKLQHCPCFARLLDKQQLEEKETTTSPSTSFDTHL